MADSRIERVSKLGDDLIAASGNANPADLVAACIGIACAMLKATEPPRHPDLDQFLHLGEQLAAELVYSPHRHTQ